MPGLTRRPHMGPFNRVTDYKISDADEVYRQHDIGYGKEERAGRSPYTRWNKYDQDLMDAPSTGWPDYVAKGVFGAKRFFTYGMPYTKNTRLRDVYGTTSKDAWEPTSYDDFAMNYQDAPVEIEGGGQDPDLIALMEQDAAQEWARKGKRTEVPAADEIHTPERGVQTGGTGRRNIHSTIRYERY